MKIAIIAHCLHPIREPFEGGLEMITFLLCRTLMERGHTVDLFAHRDSDSAFNVRPINTNKLYTSDLLSEMSGLDQQPKETREVLAYSNVMQRIVEGRYDIVHNHSLHYIPILMGNLLSVPMVTSIHTPTFPHLKLGATGIKGSERQQFTMVSESLADTWKSIIPKATVVYNGIEVSNWAPAPNATNDYVFCCGRICPEKGIHLAIQAALRAEIPIKIAGPISNREYYENYVAPLLDNADVAYLGHIDQDALVALFANASAFLFTSTWEEPYGLTLAESLACGTPVVAFEGGAVCEILTEDTGIIVPKYDIEGMAKAIEDSRLLLREDCRRRAETFCSHEHMVDGYLEVYDRALERREYALQLSL